MAKKDTWVSKPDPDYEYTEGLDADGWAWEFLRRSAQYKSAYAKFLDEKTLVSHLFFPRKREKETETTWRARVLIKLRADPRKLPISTVRARKFQLTRMYDPGTCWQKVVFLPIKRVAWRARTLGALEAIVSTIDDVDWEQRPFKSSRCVVVFDLKAAITPQIAIARDILEKASGAPTGGKALSAKKKTWTEYLRVLDLADHGHSAIQIADQVWPKYGPDQDAVEHAKGTLKQARSTCGDFRKIRLVNLG